MGVSIINTFLNGDSDVDNVMETLDKAIIGHSNISIDSADFTNIKSGSSIEVDGILYSFTTDQAFSGADFVSDGTYYYYLSTAGALKASKTAPVWDTTRQGWYQTISAVLYRYLGYTVIFTGPSTISDLRYELINQTDKIINIVSDATERTTTSSAYVTETNLTGTIFIGKDEIWECALYGRFKSSLDFGSINLDIIAGTPNVIHTGSRNFASIDTRMDIFQTIYQTNFNSIIFYLIGNTNETVSVRMKWAISSGSTLYSKDRKIIMRKIR